VKKTDRNYIEESLKMKAIIFFVSVATGLAASQAAHAESKNQSDWFIEARYQDSLYEGNGWKSSEYDTPGSESSQFQTTSSESRDSLTSAGLSVGYDIFDGNTSISIGYENFGSSTWKTGQFTAKDGRVFDSSEYPMTMHNFMIEMTQFYPISENKFIIALAGVGQAVIKTTGFAKTFSGVRFAGQIQDRQVENFTKRLGAGMGFNLSNSVQLIGLLQYSDYGRAETVGHLAGTSAGVTYDAGIVETDVNAVEASIRLRYRF
jgi:opacity protein-like surface antigen